MNAADLVREYYESWSRGGGSFDAARLRAVLADDLNFEGPIAGKRSGAEPFVHALGQLAKVVTATRMLRQVQAGNEVATLYDCDVPGGTLRFAEFLRIDGAKIGTITVHYDKTEFRALVGGPAPASARN